MSCVEYLDDLCVKLFAQGYTHASLVDPFTNDFPRMVQSDIKLLNNTIRPERAVDFSGIYLHPIPEEKNPDLHYVNLTGAVMHEHLDPHLEEIPFRDICFAKFDKTMLMQSTDPELKKYEMSYFSKKTKRERRRYNWNEMNQDGYKGFILEDPEKDGWRQRGWDRPTVEVWDKTAITKMLTFVNVGEWQYFVNDAATLQ